MAAPAYNFQRSSTGLAGPYRRKAAAGALPIVYTDPPRALHFEAAGTVNLWLWDDDQADVVTVQAGQRLEGLVRRIEATGTTVAAASIYGLW